MTLRYGIWLIAVLALVAPASSADSEQLFGQYFKAQAKPTACYARLYDKAHQRANPKQRVRAIEIDMILENTNGEQNRAGKFDLGFGLQLKTGGEWYTSSAECNTSQDAFHCYLEGDSGAFDLIPDKDGALRLETERIALEGEEDNIEIGGESSDDSKFVLLNSSDNPGECAAAEN